MPIILLPASATPLIKTKVPVVAQWSVQDEKVYFGGTNENPPCPVHLKMDNDEDQHILSYRLLVPHKLKTHDKRTKRTDGSSQSSSDTVRNSIERSKDSGRVTIDKWHLKASVYCVASLFATSRHDTARPNMVQL